jgi:hypothetical protein
MENWLVLLLFSDFYSLRPLKLIRLIAFLLILVIGKPLMERATTDTSLTRLGDHYQYLLATESCLNADEGDIIYVESLSDVAVETKDGKEAIEAKHHFSTEHQISDRHVDFWKTLKNWVINFNVLKDYKKLILHTTSRISSDSKLNEWNSSDKAGKLAILQSIKEEKVTETIRPFVERVFGFDENYTLDNLFSILDRFTISAEQPNVLQKVDEVLKREFFKSYPKKNRKHFLDDLLGFVRNKGVESPKEWRVNVTEFYSFAKSKAQFYASESLPIPSLYERIEADQREYDLYDFVKEIKRVDLDDEIPDAVNDYHRTQKTLILLSENEPSSIDEITHYREKDILKDLTLLKKRVALEVDDKLDVQKCLKHSKACYLGAMMFPLKSIKGFDPNQNFFQKGNIHIVVNDGKFSWLIE